MANAITEFPRWTDRNSLAEDSRPFRHASAHVLPLIHHESRFVAARRLPNSEEVPHESNQRSSDHGQL